ncbi:PIN domain-containing protein [Nostocoides jenkinsii]|uniref:Ribonuclease VapC n=1 Tax=Nostocoides jenkinsii Ben 74 TaxID=1193518 RepID=A0A077MCY0_9MICO|nr:PIN domain-containing protein [Tetrasphaera jenkinsii]CCI52722.1 Toxin [Tetrasphaera jenkinsii Ben 74]
MGNPRLTRGLADSSVFVAHETGRAIDVKSMPPDLAVSVITVAELRAGVLAARSVEERAIRLRTLERATAAEQLPVDGRAAQEWALLRVHLGQAGRRVNVNDLWIAAVARANGLLVVTQDDDFDVLADLGLVDVLRV